MHLKKNSSKWREFCTVLQECKQSFTIFFWLAWLTLFHQWMIKPYQKYRQLIFLDLVHGGNVNRLNKVLKLANLVLQFINGYFSVLNHDHDLQMLNIDEMISSTIRKVKFLSKNSILTKPQHFHEFFTQIFFDNFSREIKVVNS